MVIQICFFIVEFWTWRCILSFSHLVSFDLFWGVTTKMSLMLCPTQKWPVICLSLLECPKTNMSFTKMSLVQYLCSFLVRHSTFDVRRSCFLYMSSINQIFFRPSTFDFPFFYTCTIEPAKVRRSSFDVQFVCMHVR